MKDGVDMSSFDRGFELVEKARDEAIAEGAGRAGMQWLDDAVNQTPTVPLKEGTLRGSGSVHVNGKFAGTLSGEDGTPNTGTSPKPEALLVVGFNTPYAAALHEGVTYVFREPGSGAKYLSSKKTRNERQYIQIIANTLLRRFGK